MQMHETHFIHFCPFHGIMRDHAPPHLNIGYNKVTFIFHYASLVSVFVPPAQLGFRVQAGKKMMRKKTHLMLHLYSWNFIREGDIFAAIWVTFFPHRNVTLLSKMHAGSLVSFRWLDVHSLTYINEKCTHEILFKSMSILWWKILNSLESFASSFTDTTFTK